jgi:hypothetical protein
MPNQLCRYIRERAQVDAAVADTTCMQQFVGPRAVAAVLDRFGSDDDIVTAAAVACLRSLDIIEKVAAAHDGDARQALLRSCVQLLISSGLPLQLFECFCARSQCLNAPLSSRPRHQLLLKILTPTCRCVHLAHVHGVLVPAAVTASMTTRFAPAKRDDGLNQRTSLLDVMSLMMARPTLGFADNAVLLLLSLLLSHCIAFDMQPPDTIVLLPIVLHAMRHSPRLLMDVLLPNNVSAHLPLPLASHSCASLLLALASSRTISAAPTFPADAAAQLFVSHLLRVAIIAFARSGPHPTSTFAVYQRVFTLLLIAIDRVSPGFFDADQPLLQRLAVDDDGDSFEELIGIFRQFVLKDDAATEVCSAGLQAAVMAAQNPDFAQAFVPDAVEPAAEDRQHMQDEGDDAEHVPAALAQLAVLHAHNDVMFLHALSVLFSCLKSSTPLSVIHFRSQTAFSCVLKMVTWLFPTTQTRPHFLQ